MHVCILKKIVFSNQNVYNQGYYFIMFYSMKLFASLKLWEKLKNSSVRFPFAVWILVLLTVIFISVVHSNSGNIEMLLRVVASLILMFFLSIWLVIHSENIKKITSTKKYAMQSIALIFGILFFWQFNGDLEWFENNIFFILCLFWILGYLFSAPYLQKKVFHPHVYYNYLYTTLCAFILSFVIGILVLALGMIAIASMDALFWITWKVSDYLYQYWVIFATILVAPLFWLSQLPEHSSVTKKIGSLNSFARFIIKYAFFPAVCVYFVILYAYSIKLGISFGDWPKWEISWLVIGFSVLGYITYILSSLYEKENTGIALFRKYFPYLVLPQVIILFYSIYLRIAQYDLTMNRYFIVIFGICLWVLSLYFILSKEKRLIAFPVSFIIVPILVSIGPWSVYQLPASSQLASLKSELIEANILQWDTIVPLANKTDISEELSNSIYTKIDYLCDYHSCHGLEDLFFQQYPILDTSNPDYKFTQWEILSSITKNIKVVRRYDYNRDEHISFHLNTASFFPLDISGYSEMIYIESYFDKHSNVDYNSQMLTLNYNQKILEIDMKSVFDALEWNTSSNLTADQLSYDIDTEIGTIRLLIEKINWDKAIFWDLHMNAYVLIP